MKSLQSWASAGAALALVAGCHADQVSHNRIAQAAPESAPPAVIGAAPSPDMVGEVPAPPKPTGASQVAWTLPAGWTQALSGGIRYATLKAPDAGSVDISVVVLAGLAGGELANVNRWRSQIGLGPLNEASLGGARKTVASGVGPVAVYDFTSEGTVKSRLIAGLARSGDNTWFFKMTGDASLVEKAAPNFMRLLTSLQSGEKR